MKEFWKILKRYAAPYKSCMVWAVVLNILSAVFNIFSFTLIIPILNILFKIDNVLMQELMGDIEKRDLMGRTLS